MTNWLISGIIKEIRREVLLKTKQRLLEIVRFGISGGIGVIIGYITLYSLTEYFGFWYLLSSMIACFLSYSIGFIFQKFWTFKSKDSKTIRKQIILYVIISILFFIANTGLMYLFVEYYQIQYILSQIIVTIFLSVISYLSSRFIFAH